MWVEIDSTTSVCNEATYKIQPPEDISEHAAYFTIVGDPEPMAFFFNSKSMKSFQWITGLMTSWSRQLEAGIPITSIIEDMKETFQPGGDYYISGTNQQVHSFIHHLGIILEKDVQRLKTIQIQKLVDCLIKSKDHQPEPDKQSSLPE